MGKSIRSGNFKLPVVAIIVLLLPLHCTNGGAKAEGCIYVHLTLEKKQFVLDIRQLFPKVYTEYKLHSTHFNS